MILGLMALVGVVGWGLSALMQMHNGGMILFIILAVLGVELAAELVIAAWMVTPIHGILHLLGLPLRLRGRSNAPLQQKNIRRATCGAFVLVPCVFIAANGFPVIGWQATAAIAALALLYLVVGVVGAQGSRFDVMRVFWWGVLALGCGALLVFIEGIRL